MIAALTTLPTELLYEITEQLDRQSLLHCARTCQLLAKIIAAKLWKVIPRLTPQKTLQLIRALSTSPNAGTVVLEISINGSSAIQLQSTPSTPRPPTVHEIIAHGLGGLFQFSKSQSYTPTVSTPGASELSIQTFSTAFQKMINLRKLVIHSWACSSKLWGFTLFIPTLCEVFVYREAESIELLGWIKGQSNLTRLRLWVPQRWQDGGSFLLNKPTISFPHLQSLTTTPRGAIILLQCSSVSDLIIENIVNLPKRTINTHELAKAIVQKSISGVLKRLTLDGRDSDVLGLLVLLQGRLPNLHSLRIVFSGRIHGTFNLPSGPANVRDCPTVPISLE